MAQLQSTIAILLLALCGALITSCSDGNGLIFPAPTVSIANLNIQHGFDCDPPLPDDGDQCRIRDRVTLFADLLIEKGCPDIVTLQEIVNKEFAQRSPTESAGPLDSIVELIEAQLPRLNAACGFSYELLYQPFLPTAVAETDEELILSRYPVVQSDTHILHSALYDEAGGFLIFARHLLYARIAHPTGDIDVYTTHLSSGSDAASNSCNSFRELVPGIGVGPRVDCPAECDVNDTVRACQAEQLALYVEQTRGDENLALISGDFNALPGSSEYNSMVGRTWLDSHLAAGTAECDAQSGSNCTSGRSGPSGDLELPTPGVRRRIDYIFVASPKAAAACTPDPSQPGRRGSYSVSEAGLFAGEVNPFADVCGPLPSPICWTSDHSGNYASVSCQG